MFGFNKDKDRGRFYLLPGMSGRAARRKHRTLLIWAIVVGLLTSAALTGAMYFLDRLWR